MFDREVALEALGVICNATVTSVQKQGSQAGLQSEALGGGAVQTQLPVKQLVCVAVDGDETCPVSRRNFDRIQILHGCAAPSAHPLTSDISEDKKTGKVFIIDEDEFFDPVFDYDFTNLKDTQTYYRGGEVYERPCGWNRLALKVLNKYDENTWLGNEFRSTQSVPGEWPVSYHGTTGTGAEGIIEGHYKPGSRQRYGRGVYSSPVLLEALRYAKTFTSKKTGKKYQVILQNRVNPKYRQKHNNDKYWLVPIPAGTSTKEEREMVERAIRPYGLLVREI